MDVRMYRCAEKSFGKVESSFEYSIKLFEVTLNSQISTYILYLPVPTYLPTYIPIFLVLSHIPKDYGP